jgi:hypothetical protein
MPARAQALGWVGEEEGLQEEKEEALAAQPYFEVRWS